MAVTVDVVVIFCTYTEGRNKMKNKPINTGDYKHNSKGVLATVLDVESVSSGYTVKYFHPTIQGDQLLRMAQSKFKKLFCAI